jgi:hypothetical protein
MSGNVIPAPMRQRLFSTPSTAEGPDACGADMAGDQPRTPVGSMTRPGIAAAAILARRSIAMSALALASQAQPSVLQLLR